MCRGGRLVADFMAGAGTRPDVPEELEEHLTVTADESWAVWAYKLARPQGELFIPLTGGPGYPADARANAGSGTPTMRPTRSAPAVSTPCPTGTCRGCPSRALSRC